MIKHRFPKTGEMNTLSPKLYQKRWWGEATPEDRQLLKGKGEFWRTKIIFV